MSNKFEAGQKVATRGVMDWMEEDVSIRAGVFACLQRHLNGDWGDLHDDDKALNDAAIENEDRILSAYVVQGRKIWIITEYDRSVTTILFPEEY